jgi:tetratricopeptide (TPR) repeat protein
MRKYRGIRPRGSRRRRNGCPADQCNLDGEYVECGALSTPNYSGFRSGPCYNGPEPSILAQPVTSANTTRFLFLVFSALALTVLSPDKPNAAEPDVRATVQALQDEWAVIFYTLPEDQHVAKFKNLLERVHAVSERHPDRAEPLILEAIVLCTYAGAEFSFSALGKVERARALLQKAIDIDPDALEASAYVALGNLYHRLPGWPISYGDDDIARQYFETAARLYPDAIDTNYFLGDFLLSQGDFEKAGQLLEKADRAPIRPGMQLSDRQLKTEIAKALADARTKNDDRADFFSQFIPSFGSDKQTP